MKLPKYIIEIMHYLQQNPVPADDTQFLSKPSSASPDVTKKDS